MTAASYIPHQERVLSVTLGLNRTAIDALLFDVDGTLYDQRSLRAVMALQLAKAACLHPWRTRREVAVLRAYRHAQEELRAESVDDAQVLDLAAEQLRRAAERSQIVDADHAAIVRAWMELRPLPFLSSRGRPGLIQFLERARAARLKLGVVSDYPAREKLQALGVASFFDVVVCAQDRAVGRFKPHPRGLLAAAISMGISPERILYIGDRADVDGAAARAAGMQCVIVGRNDCSTAPADLTPILDFNALGDLLFRE